MIAQARALCEADALERHEPRANPGPAEMQATAAAIRRSWTPRQRRHRAHVARTMLLQQRLARLQTLLCTDPEPVVRVTPRFPPWRW